RALGELPELNEALASGELTFTAVRELTRVVTPETEDEWIEAATDKNVRQIEELVAGHRPGDRPSDPGDPAVRTRVGRPGPRRAPGVRRAALRGARRRPAGARAPGHPPGDPAPRPPSRRRSLPRTWVPIRARSGHPPHRSPRRRRHERAVEPHCHVLGLPPGSS